MEIKINKEIREYTESIFFGLSLRQLIFALLAVAAAIGLFFSLRSVLHIEVLGWVCIVGAFPFGALGFIRYNGMPFEKLAAAIIRSVVLMPEHLVFRSDNLMMRLMESNIKTHRKDMKRRDDKDITTKTETR